MKSRTWIALVAVGAFGLGLGSTMRLPRAVAQKPRDDATWEYKVAVVSFNPGERRTDEQRAAILERTLNEQARQGWEPVGSLLSRDAVQTVGGAVTTRDTTSFLAFRRRR
ncbi:hypothetical protein TA3x_000656 [Tundrisphaera sp. TA3]|uniref:hypothetical protein n=1 Tax=Tundrisphaera sp. TA3 TaxID=3435775 RepID=UPI003EBDBA35